MRKLPSVAILYLRSRKKSRGNTQGVAMGRYRGTVRDHVARAVDLARERLYVHRAAPCAAPS
jgi:hypothetical protein